MLVWFLLPLLTGRSNDKVSALFHQLPFFPLRIHYPLRYVQKMFNASAMYTDLKHHSPPTLPNKTLKLLQHAVGVIVAFIILWSLSLFSVLNHSIREKFKQSYHLHYKHHFSFHQSENQADADTQLLATLFKRDQQLNALLSCWGFLAQVGLQFCFLFVLPFLDAFLAILWLLIDVAGQLGVLVPG